MLINIYFHFFFEIYFLMFLFIAFIEFTKRLDQLEIRIDTDTVQRLWNSLTLNMSQSIDELIV